MSEIWIANETAGAELGTREEPFVARDSKRFDSLMREYAPHDHNIHLAPGRYESVFTRYWGDKNELEENPGFRVGRSTTIDLEPGAVLSWDVDAVEDEHVDNVPRAAFTTIEGRFFPGEAGRFEHTPEEIWDLLPRGQRVRGGTINLRFPQAAARWKAAGKVLRVGAVALGGHEAAIEATRVTNYGALGYEAFLLYTQAAYGMFDQNLLAKLDPATHVIDAGVPPERCRHTTDNIFEGYDADNSEGQVSCVFIAGNIGQREPGVWQQHRGAWAYASGNRATITDPRPNQVQLVTIYQSPGRIHHNYSSGLIYGAYGDYLSSFALEVDLNRFLKCINGVRFILSPTSEGAENAWQQFSHEDHRIGLNEIDSSGPNVFLDPMGPMTATRYMRNISVDASLTLNERGEQIATRTGKVLASRGGCARYIPFLK